MNKDTRRGFAVGLLTAGLVLSLGAAGLAAGRTIQVEDGIAVTINGVPFTPRDANGDKVPLFAYNGTTYAPVRAFSKAAGLTVDYDAAARTARIETPDYAVAADPNAQAYITAERARELALSDAGVTAGNAFFLKSYLDWEDGRAVYDVEFCVGTTEYDYELDALTGAVLEKDYECEDYDWAHRVDYHNHHDSHQESHHSDTHHSAAQIPADLISADRAREIAAERLGGSVQAVTECELDFDDGCWKYELELYLNGWEYDCVIDAATGDILKWKADRD